MKKVDTLGKILHFDRDTNIISYKISFVDDNLLGQIEDLLKYPHLIKLSFEEVKPFRSKTYKQQCQFWVDFGKILRKQGLEKTKEITEVLYDRVKKNIFPCKQIIIGYDIDGNPKYDYYIPNMGDLSIEEMKKVIIKFREWYSYLNIEWDKID